MMLTLFSASRGFEFVDTEIIDATGSAIQSNRFNHSHSSGENSTRTLFCYTINNLLLLESSPLCSEI